MTTIGPVGLSGIDALYFELSEAEDDVRKASRDCRRAAEQGQVQAMLEQADHIEQAALLNGISQGVTGLCTIAGGAIDMAGTTGAITEGTAGASKAFTKGSGDVTAAVFGYAAGVEQADQKRAEARATALGSEAADARELEQEARGTQDQLARRLESAQSQQSEARRAALRA